MIGKSGPHVQLHVEKVPEQDRELVTRTRLVKMVVTVRERAKRLKPVKKMILVNL